MPAVAKILAPWRPPTGLPPTWWHMAPDVRHLDPRNTSAIISSIWPDQCNIKSKQFLCSVISLADSTWIKQNGSNWKSKVSVVGIRRLQTSKYTQANSRLKSLRRILTEVFFLVVLTIMNDRKRTSTPSIFYYVYTYNAHSTGRQVIIFLTHLSCQPLSHCMPSGFESWPDLSDCRDSCHWMILSLFLPSTCPQSVSYFMSMDRSLLNAIAIDQLTLVTRTSKFALRMESNLICIAPCLEPIQALSLDPTLILTDK